ncbi:hypothetical protein Tco_0266616 [Tanacetum coccineum]
MTTTMFSATTPENTPSAYRASTSANPNNMISPAFVEANYEFLESLLRERRRQMRNEDIQTGLEYFSSEKESYDLKKLRTEKEAGVEEMPKILGLHKEQRISGFVHGLRTRSLVEHLSMDLLSTYKGLMEKTYTRIKAREVATNGAPRE